MEKQEEEKKLEELMKLFKVKKNPVMSFWFIPSYVITEGLNTVPEGYELYKEKVLPTGKTIGIMWRCYIKKEVRGLVSKSYWSTER